MHLLDQTILERGNGTMTYNEKRARDKKGWAPLH